MRLLLPFAVLTVAAAAQTEPPSLQALVNNSPFGTAAQAATATAAGTPLEFRGTFVDGGERFFSIVDTATRRAEWVSLNESGRPYVVRNFDTDRETITVEHQGRTLNLKLHSARVGVLPPMQTAQAPAAAQPSNGAQPAAQQPSAAEAQRLAQVAEEIRRRRALRQQSAQPTNAQPTNVQPPASQPPRS